MLLKQMVQCQEWSIRSLTVAVDVVKTHRTRDTDALYRERE